MKIVTLRNGREVPEVVVNTTMLAVKTLAADPMNGIALYELVMMAKEPGHSPFGNTGSILTSFGLLQQGQMHEAVRDVIDAAFEMDGFDIVSTPLVAA